MFSNLIQTGALWLVAPVVTDVFLVVLLAVFLLSCFLAVRVEHTEFIQYTPTLLTSIGILGTFVGIVLGLFHFNTHQIDQSIPTLLEGLKTAFITSVAGMGSAMLFSLLDVLLFAKKRRALAPQSAEQITPQHIYQVLVDQQQLQQQQYTQMELFQKNQTQHFTQLEQRLSDLRISQQEQTAWFSEQLWQRLDAFSHMLSKAATDQIVDALRQVIVDFNQQLTEQFGDNFKALDASVAKLVLWQQQYKEQIQTMGQQYEHSVNSLAQTRQAVAGIWQECANIPAAMDDIRETILVNQHQIVELRRHLEAFSQLRDAAVAALPTIQNQVVKMNEQVAGTVEHLERSAEGFERYVTDIVNNTGKTVNNQLQQLETATAREIQVAIEEMGQSLVQITTRFVNDYQTMTHAMSQVIQQHRK